MAISTTVSQVPIGELVQYFLRLGLLGFGGPVALVGQMERELVAERQWPREQMREALPVASRFPDHSRFSLGSTSPTCAGGFWRAWAGRWAFILPNFGIAAGFGAL
jgi:chromate transporter